MVKHRMENVGSLRYSDEDCLDSERIGMRIGQMVRTGAYNSPVGNHFKCECLHALDNTIACICEG